MNSLTGADCVVITVTWFPVAGPYHLQIIELPLPLPSFFSDRGSENNLK
jgi:hypothetical protein